MIIMMTIIIIIIIIIIIRLRKTILTAEVGGDFSIKNHVTCMLPGACQRQQK